MGARGPILRQLHTLPSQVMAFSSSRCLPCEGVFAINKPPGISSAQVIRNAQSHFNDSIFFKPWLEREQARKNAENHNQRQKRRSWKQRQPLQVKMGHGGTLDPMATGVLILGVGIGTKKLGSFLGCTKSYDAVLLFGAATDSYDGVGKIVARKAYERITRERVEEALDRFRGKIMQRPPIFSALRVQGKKLYEYAREGKEVPIDIEERPVEVERLEIVDWMDGGTHGFHWPEEEAAQEEKEVAEKVLHLGSPIGAKRKREDEPTNGDRETGDDLSTKRPKVSGGAEVEPANEDGAQVDDEPNSTKPPSSQKLPCPAPACRLRMTVTSGFYVRSLCHDLGAAVDSAGLMASLVRTRQGDFELGENVLDYDDLEKGEKVWSPKIAEMLQEWQNREEDEGEVKVDRPQERSRSRSPSPQRTKRKAQEG